MSLLSLIQAAQSGLLKAMHALGLSGEVAGQPAWPFDSRIDTGTLAIDPGLERQLAWALGLSALALLLLLAGGWLRRRSRWAWAGAWAAAAACVWLAPWPPLALLLTDAVPTSFHRSKTHFDAASIDRGLQLFEAHCAACHGSDGRGEGPLAAQQRVWPPTLSAGLPWKRAEGELLWHVLHGMKDRSGAPTMPGFADRLQTADVWALLDGMKALAAGDNLQREKAWAWPVQAPTLAADCARAWRGQRVRIVAADDGVPAPREDPLFVTVMLHRQPLAPGPDCAAGWRAYARIAGVPDVSLAGTQFLVDRDGWLRAVNRPGEPAWSEDSLVCRSPNESPTPSGAAGLDALIARIDADPVRLGDSGLPHTR
ncbi:c-type cytochrome [Paucibacter sp. R3-3]|uniref:C-type cytochrome n=1 Tax=Roseateles agri TaxID=3098619 RepID=A0ABU5DN58_9BURK|nr:c-type cytochrome [Paucibacter sp. R3-3]MDY0747740.1 c-type cytochrome [Paucibacter sp. R3-3]